MQIRTLSDETIQKQGSRRLKDVGGVQFDAVLETAIRGVDMPQKLEGKVVHVKEGAVDRLMKKKKVTDHAVDFFV